MKIVAIHAISPSLRGDALWPLRSTGARACPLVGLRVTDSCWGVGRLMLASVDRGLGKDGKTSGRLCCRREVVEGGLSPHRMSCQIRDVGIPSARCCFGHVSLSFEDRHGVSYPPCSRFEAAKLCGIPFLATSLLVWKVVQRSRRPGLLRSVKRLERILGLLSGLQSAPCVVVVALASLWRGGVSF